VAPFGVALATVFRYKNVCCPSDHQMCSVCVGALYKLCRGQWSVHCSRTSWQLWVCRLLSSCEQDAIIEPAHQRSCILQPLVATVHLNL